MHSLFPFVYFDAIRDYLRRTFRWQRLLNSHTFDFFSFSLTSVPACTRRVETTKIRTTNTQFVPFSQWSQSSIAYIWSSAKLYRCLHWLFGIWPMLFQYTATQHCHESTQLVRTKWKCDVMCVCCCWLGLLILLAFWEWGEVDGGCDNVRCDTSETSEHVRRMAKTVCRHNLSKMAYMRSADVNSITLITCVVSSDVHFSSEIFSCLSALLAEDCECVSSVCLLKAK